LAESKSAVGLSELLGVGGNLLGFKPIISAPSCVVFEFKKTARKAKYEIFLREKMYLCRSWQ
jgi:hypothetical protein